MDYQSPNNREVQNENSAEEVRNDDVIQQSPHSPKNPNENGSPHSPKNPIKEGSPHSPKNPIEEGSPHSPKNPIKEGSPQSPEDLDREERLAAARAKASAAKVSAQRRSSRRSMSSADRSLTDFGSEPRSRDGSAHRRSSIRSFMHLTEETERELEELDGREAAEAERLQLYSEVIALRKELVVVQGEEARARRQREMGAAVVALKDDALEESAAVFEEAAQRSSLQHIWSNVSAEYPNDMAEDVTNWLRLNTEEMPQRLEAAKRDFEEAQKEADKLYAVQEEKINAQTDERDKTKSQLEESLREEMANLEETRARLQQLQREQRHHIKRGTHVKELHVPQQRRRDIAEGRIQRNENKTFANKFALENEYTELTEQVKQSKRVLEDNKRDNKKSEEKLEKTLKETEESGKDVHELREKLEKESEELKGLKQDLQRVLQYVRARNYAGED